MSSSDGESLQTKGWLQMGGMGLNKKKWKNMFVVIGGPHLMYYKGDSEAKNGKDPKGQIFLVDVDIEIVDEKEHGRAHCFSVHSNFQKKKFVFQAANPAERDEWLLSLMSHKLEVKTASLPYKLPSSLPAAITTTKEKLKEKFYSLLDEGTRY